MFSAASSVVDELSGSFGELAKSAFSAGDAALAYKTAEGMTNPNTVGYQIETIDLNSLPIASQLDELKRNLSRKSNEYVFADTVKDCITVNERRTDISGLNKVIELAECSTANNPTQWNGDQTIATSIHALATTWKRSVYEAGSRLLKELQASCQARDGQRALGALCRSRTFEQIVIFNTEFCDLDNACFATSVMLLEGLNMRLTKKCDEAGVPRDLLGKIDNQWLLGAILDADKSEIQNLLHALRQAYQLSWVSKNAPANQCSTLATKKKAASDIMEYGQKLLRAAEHASSYADNIRQRCAAAGLKKPEEWLTDNPPQLTLSTILAMVEKQHLSAKRVREEADEKVRRVRQEASSYCQNAEAAMSAQLEQAEKEKQQLQQQVQMGAGFLSGMRLGAGLVQGSSSTAQSAFSSSGVAGPSCTFGTPQSSFGNNALMPPRSSPQITLLEPLSSDPFDSRPLCRYYRQGRCKFGGKCVNRHG